MEKQWITLYPDTFIWIKNNWGFVYDSLKFRGHRFRLSKRIKEIYEELSLPENLYTAILNSEDASDTEVADFVHTITKTNKMGFINTGKEERPVSFLPKLKIINEHRHYEWEHNQGFGGSILRNLHELKFYINSSETGNNSFYKQTSFPLKDCQQLDPSSILTFIKNSQNPFLTNITLVGNIFRYPNYQVLLKRISENTQKCIVKITIEDFSFHFQEMNNTVWPQNISFDILIHSSTGCHKIDLSNFNTKITATLLVDSENDYKAYFEKYFNIPIYCDAQVIPIFNGVNNKFFEENVYINQEDLDNIKLTKREIFINQTLNTNDFGKLTILPDGTVYANVNMNPIGKICDSPYSIMLKEFMEGESFFRIRNQAPCTECVYQWMCPSLSNYEIEFGHLDLCHINPSYL